MYVTTVDFQANMDKYLAMVSQEDIFITANGKTVAQMTQPKESVVDSPQRAAEGCAVRDNGGGYKG